MGVLDSLVHASDERLAGTEVPGLQHCGVAGLLQGVGDPFGPGGIGAGVADEEVALLVHLPAPTDLPVYVPTEGLVLSHCTDSGMGRRDRRSGSCKAGGHLVGGTSNTLGLERWS